MFGIISRFTDNEVNKESNLYLDLELDSLDIVEIIMTIEKEYDITIVNDDPDNYDTVQDLINEKERILHGNSI